MTTTQTPPADQAKTATVTLNTPIRRGDTAIAEIVLIKPKGGALRGLNVKEVFNAEYNALRTLVPRIASPQVLESDLDEMDAEDILSIASEVMGFFMTPDQLAAIRAHVGIAPPEQSTS